MCTLNEYLENINEKTIFVVCLDCYCTGSLVSNPNVLVCTAFGMVLHGEPGSCFGSESFKAYVEKEEVKQIILAGHYPCQVLPFLINDEGENVHWQRGKVYLRNLKDSFAALSQKDADCWKKLIHFHISTQVQKVSQMFLNEFGVSECVIPVKGIVIEENNIVEIEHLEAIRFPVSLN